MFALNGSNKIISFQFYSGGGGFAPGFGGGFSGANAQANAGSFNGGFGGPFGGGGFSGANGELLDKPAQCLEMK